MRHASDVYPIDMERVKQLAYLPVKLAELAEKNPAAALELLTAWGKGTKPITHLWKETLTLIEQYNHE